MKENERGTVVILMSLWVSAPLREKIKTFN